MRKLIVSFLVLLLMVPLIPVTADSTEIAGNELVYNPPPDWSAFWTKFNQISDWNLEYYNGAQWVSVKSDLQVVREYPAPNKTKLTLIFDASHAANYRLSFAINKVVRNYTTRLSEYVYELNYENFTMIWDWSDAVAIPGLVFTHGLLNDMFWFRMRRDNVPLGAHVEIDPTLIASYDETNQDTFFALQDEHPSNVDGEYSAAGQSFQTGATPLLLTNAVFYMMKTNSPTGTMTAVLYAHSGVYGTSSKPTGAALATSDTYNVTGLTGAYQLINFTFSGANRYPMSTATSYCIAVVNSGNSVSTSNYPRVGADFSAPTATGNAFYFNNGSWENPGGATDTIFYVSGDGTYKFYFDNAIYENNTDAGQVIVTATSIGSTESFPVEDSTWYYATTLPQTFSWDIGGGFARYVYITEEENFTITMPEATDYVYGFIIKDYTGKLGLGGAYLEAWRTIGGVEKLVSRMPIQQPNTIPINLVYGRTYNIKILYADGSRLTWGYFVAGGSFSPTILLRDIEFDQTAYLVNTFLTVEAQRSNETLITVDYLDERSETIWANVTVRIRNGAIVATYNSNSSGYTWNYAGAVSGTNYIVTVQGLHVKAGNWGYSNILDAVATFPTLPTLTGVFTLGGIDIGEIIGYVIALMGYLGFSYRWKGPGMMGGLGILALVRFIGLITMNYYLLAAIGFLSIAVALLAGGET